MNHSSPDDWEALYDQYAGKMMLFAKQFVGCEATAEDVVQEGFLRFWRNRKKREAEKMASHLFGCVRWAALDWLRKNGRTRKREDAYGEEQVLLQPSNSFECPVETEETAELVEQALEKLPTEQREVVVLKLWSGLTLQEIGDALEISPNTAASRYRYAIGSLRKEFERKDYAEGTGRI